MSNCSASFPRANITPPVRRDGVPGSMPATRSGRVVPPGARPGETLDGAPQGQDTQERDAHVLPAPVFWRFHRVRRGAGAHRHTRQLAEDQTSARVPGTPRRCGPGVRASSGATLPVPPLPCRQAAEAQGQSSVTVAATGESGASSDRMSMRHPVILAASRAFWPSFPIASDSW
jgi:hypothetical protein